MVDSFWHIFNITSNDHVWMEHIWGDIPPPDPKTAPTRFPRKTRVMFGAKRVAHPIPHSTIEVKWLKSVTLVGVNCLGMG